jgi:hypothetical protein
VYALCYTTTKPLDKVYGFSAVKFVPFRENEFVLLKTTEVDRVNTSMPMSLCLPWCCSLLLTLVRRSLAVMMVVDVHGKVLMDAIDVGSVKYEGFEFL